MTSEDLDGKDWSGDDRESLRRRGQDVVVRVLVLVGRGEVGGHGGGEVERREEGSVGGDGDDGT